ncbi:MAG: nuclear transport factor 2 family protein [Deltaproteobacteria bacterium]|nr:nuclear transport factor 2 family protein [Deltaproteobacteria bacterium]
MSYRDALERTDPKKVQTLEPSSVQEREAIDRFSAFISNLTQGNIRAMCKAVYAADAFFNDTLTELNGAEEIERYFIRTAQTTERVIGRITAMAVSDGDYYFRWEMDVQFKKFKKGQIMHSIGMTHIRFDDHGKVVLHQDYWDAASGLFEHIPVLGSVIRLIKSRL